ncbi:MAG: response regulator [Bacteriovoracaceae bacterium]
MTTNPNHVVKILIVDDSEFSRKIVAKILVEEGYNVVGEAANANDAIEILNSNQGINIILIDIIMPDVNGIELARKIHKSYEDSSIVMMSSLAQDHVVIEAISAGAVDFLKKPFERQTLLDSVEKLSRELIKKTQGK